MGMIPGFQDSNKNNAPSDDEEKKKKKVFVPISASNFLIIIRPLP